MLVIGDIVIVDELKDNQNQVIKQVDCIVTDNTQGILELMPYSLFFDIYNDCYTQQNNKLYYFVDDEKHYMKIGRIDKKIIRELFDKMNHLKGSHVFEYIMPK